MVFGVGGRKKLWTKKGDNILEWSCGYRYLRDVEEKFGLRFWWLLVVTRSKVSAHRITSSLYTKIRADESHSNVST